MSNPTVASLAMELATYKKEVDSMYLLICGALVVFMQAGFAMLEAGTVKSVNVRNVLFKNLADACLGGIVFWLLGYGFAYGGSDDSSFIGDSSSGGKNSFAFRVDAEYDSEYERVNIGYAWITFFFQYAFAAAATTIVSGAVAGRTKLTAYLAYSVLITGFIYPVVVHWVWDGEGWISAFSADTFKGGMIDFAGSGVVHMVGGIAALVGAIAVGPRKGRFESDSSGQMFNAHSAPLQVLGTFILFVGWFGFNCGSTLGVAGYSHAMARAAVTTTLCAVAGGLTTTILGKIIDGKWDLGMMCNGILAGLVSITAGCSVVESWASILIGIIGGLVCFGASRALVYLKIDDPLDAFPVHGACGAWGCIAVGLFCTSDYTYNTKGYEGLFYGGGELLGVQLVGILCEMLWVGGTTVLLFFSLSQFGLLRVSEEEEEQGLDISEHEGPAYVIATTYGGPPMKVVSKAAVTPSAV
jgi:Amt family ammonium transporter